MFSLIACCPTLNILLENDVKNEVSYLEGVYTFQGFSNGMDYWVHSDGQYAIWYLEIYSMSILKCHWIVGLLSKLGSSSAIMYSLGTALEKKCPNEGNVSNWEYFSSNSVVETNDVDIKCVYEGNCKYSR